MSASLPADVMATLAIAGRPLGRAAEFLPGESVEARVTFRDSSSRALLDVLDASMVWLAPTGARIAIPADRVSVGVYVTKVAPAALGLWLVGASCNGPSASRANEASFRLLAPAIPDPLAGAVTFVTTDDGAAYLLSPDGRLVILD